MSFIQWLNSWEHLERTAVLLSDAGSAKTAILHASAQVLAIRYQGDARSPHYLSCGTVNGLKSAY